MKLEKRIPSGREKDQAAIELLDRLREQLYCSNITVIRRSAFNLSWLQEDGLDILKEALFMEESPRKTKCAAAYGLRKMRGRMKKKAREVLLEGSQSTNPEIAEICSNALKVMDQKPAPARPKPRPKRRKKHHKQPRLEIREIPPRGTAANKTRRAGRPANHK
ncbi:MAG: hypothetical protein QHH07_06515 [Sedimentisphaerales bacterium]|nr:hypothetical protein [Sedimentisphaerales bacterium]